MAALTVRVATRLQSLDAHSAITTRHVKFLTQVQAFDAADAALPDVCGVLARWWHLRVCNNFKEAAWRLSLNAFPTARRMGRATPCVACGAHSPDAGHHFWSCSVARSLRSELQRQLAAHNLLPGGAELPCAAVWLGQKPNVRLVTWVWDLVCVAALHALDVGRSAAWAISRRLVARLGACCCVTCGSGGILGRIGGFCCHHTRPACSAARGPHPPTVPGVARCCRAGQRPACGASLTPPPPLCHANWFCPIGMRKWRVSVSCEREALQHAPG